MVESEGFKRRLLDGAERGEQEANKSRCSRTRGPIYLATGRPPDASDMECEVLLLAYVRIPPDGLRTTDTPTWYMASLQRARADYIVRARAADSLSIPHPSPIPVSIPIPCNQPVARVHGSLVGFGVPSRAGELHGEQRGDETGRTRPQYDSGWCPWPSILFSLGSSPIVIKSTSTIIAGKRD